MTNILRDVAEDYRNGRRIYLPLAEMRGHGYSEADLAAEKYNPSFVSLMENLARQAEHQYVAARKFLAREDRRNLLPGVIMGDIYENLLLKMQRDHFQVFQRRYGISKPQKVAILLKRTLRTLVF